MNYPDSLRRIAGLVACSLESFGAHFAGRNQCSARSELTLRLGAQTCD